MRIAASQFGSKADRAAVVLSRLNAQVNSMVYTGPAADQFRAAMAFEMERLREIIAAIHRVVEVLNAGAAKVEADPLGFYGAQGWCAVITIDPNELTAARDVAQLPLRRPTSVRSWACVLHDARRRRASSTSVVAASGARLRRRPARHPSRRLITVPRSRRPIRSPLPALWSSRTTSPAPRPAQSSTRRSAARTAV
jgi:uncharacterized protein YukE